MVVLRGALDGLAAVIPRGDPAWDGLRDDVRLDREAAEAAFPLDGFFVLHPAMPRLHRMYREREALFLHAVATPYRERSHFDGQHVLETGLAGVERDASGWMNRMVAALPGAERASTAGARGLAVAEVAPLIMRGPAPIATWSPVSLRGRSPEADLDVAERLLALYDRTDPELHAALARAQETSRLAGGAMAQGAMAEGAMAEGAMAEGAMAQGAMSMHGAGQAAAPGAARQWVAVAEGAARLMRVPDGPRVAAVSFDGWDTHRNEGVAEGRLHGLLGALDLALDSYRAALGPVWRDTQVLVVTEFGRTVRENGTDGTDHGTGSLAMLLGGRVRGGRVLADWPGLAERQLLGNRDLKPTTDLRAVVKGVLGEGFGLEGRALADILPGSNDVKPLRGLLA